MPTNFAVSTHAGNGQEAGVSFFPKQDSSDEQQKAKNDGQTYKLQFGDPPASHCAFDIQTYSSDGGGTLCDLFSRYGIKRIKLPPLSEIASFNFPVDAIKNELRGRLMGLQQGRKWLRFAATYYKEAIDPLKQGTKTIDGMVYAIDTECDPLNSTASLAIPFVGKLLFARGRSLTWHDNRQEQPFITVTRGVTTQGAIERYVNGAVHSVANGQYCCLVDNQASFSLFNEHGFLGRSPLRNTLDDSVRSLSLRSSAASVALTGDENYLYIVLGLNFGQLVGFRMPLAPLGRINAKRGQINMNTATPFSREHLERVFTYSLENQLSPPYHRELRIPQIRIWEEDNTKKIGFLYEDSLKHGDFAALLNKGQNTPFVDCLFDGQTQAFDVYQPPTR